VITRRDELQREMASCLMRGTKRAGDGRDVRRLSLENSTPAVRGAALGSIEYALGLSVCSCLAHVSEPALCVREFVLLGLVPL